LSAVKDNYGEIFCYLCVFVDVTEEVEAVKRFEVASRAKSRFLAQMSHEIRTPINAVLGMNEMILRESENEEILEYAGNIDSAGNTLLSLINSILDFSKIEDGKMEIVPVNYDTASFVNDLYHSIIQRADAKGLAFVMEIDGMLPCTLKGDDVRFSQVIMNLLTNAVKYTEKGSVTLSMKVAGKVDKKVSIAVSVKDTGMGIRDEDRERLFESFERLDEVKNHSIEGTGLGMSIVTNLLMMMGSRLDVDSTYGEGSVFSFVIEQEIMDDTPIGDYEKRLQESRVHKDKEDVIYAPGASILMVDDNDMNLKVARNLLKLCGIKPEEAVSGEETIEKMKESTYDIVFLDHMMPGMDGIETLHRLQSDGLIPEETVMIALTANAVVGARENYLKEGFSDYLSKPVEIRHLVEKLVAYLPERAYQNKIKEKIPDGTGSFDKATESVQSEPEGIMEFTPAEEDGIMEFEPEEEDGTLGYEDAGNNPEYDLDRLKESGMDVDAGLSYCGGEQSLYFEMLRDFTISCKEKLSQADRLYLDKNWHEYEVAVHAMKSNAKMIGA
ncbi:MAG: response regulator, partial [Lachnospiraceae bacterium]|nr:response regulator [Lachnospiraceae bacterium]